jgi:hypothetical protein
MLLSTLPVLLFRDYVEFPSQILERWLETPEVLNNLHCIIKLSQFRWLWWSVSIKHLLLMKDFNGRNNRKLIDRYETAFSR